jgi:hypothetical protein
MVHEEGPDDIVENCHDCESEKTAWLLGRETMIANLYTIMSGCSGAFSAVAKLSVDYYHMHHGK